MALQVFLASPHLLEHEDIIFLYVLVDMPAETARMKLALLSRRSEDSQCLITLLGRYNHPGSCENHRLVSLFALTQDPRLGLDGFLDKTKSVSIKGVAK